MHQSKLTEKIIGAAFDVSNELGCGFLEKVYENALMIRFIESGINAESQRPIKIRYHNNPVGEYFADIVVENSIILEIKAVEGLTPIHKAQLINYLKATRIQIGLLINFGKPRLQYRRFDNRHIKSPASPSSL